MTESQARALVTRLVAAYPRERLDEANVALYVERMMVMQHPESADRAVTALIDTAPRFPTVAEIRDAYKAARRTAARQPALPAAPPSEHDRQKMLGEARELARTVGRRIP